MKKKLFAFTLTLASLFGSDYIDSDFDGVSDKLDQCPNTPFEHLVDETGCSDISEFKVALGMTLNSDKYDQDRSYNNLSTQLDAAYIKGSWHYEVLLYYCNLSQYQDRSYPQNNNTVSNVLETVYTYLGYTASLESISDSYISFITGLSIPTSPAIYGSTIPSLSEYVSFTKYFDFLSVFATLGYTLNGNTTFTNYDNIFSYALGGGFFLGDKLYTSLTYSNVAQINGNERYADSFALYLNYYFNDTYYTSLYYAYGINKSATYNTANIMIGVRF